MRSRMASKLGPMRVPAPPAESIHRVPKSRVVDRVDRLLELTAGRRVIDLGFVDSGRMRAKREHGAWLHARLAEAAGDLVGIDADEEGVALARELGYDAHAADCESSESLAALGLEPAEIVLAGELIEHLDRPGAFLAAARALVAEDGLLVITTPNAGALTNTLAGLLGVELVNSDHVGWQSWHTLKTLLERNGWHLRSLEYYRFPSLAPDGLRVQAFNTYQRLARPLFKLRPSLADGLIVTAAP